MARTTIVKIIHELILTVLVVDKIQGLTVKISLMLVQELVLFLLIYCKSRLIDHLEEEKPKKEK